MSLGSDFGYETDQTSVAANNAVLAGTIVVASAGNYGDSYFLTGSPGTASRVISVASSADGTDSSGADTGSGDAGTDGSTGGSTGSADTSATEGTGTGDGSTSGGVTPDDYPMCMADEDCSDPYTASRAGSQGNLGPKRDIRASSGYFPYPPSGGTGVANTLSRRIQVRLDDLNPAIWPGAAYFTDAVYVQYQDAQAGNGANNNSWRPIAVPYNNGGTGSTRGAIMAMRTNVTPG